MLTPRKRSRPTTFFAFLFFACLLLGGMASAAPSITLSKKSGPPTSKILVSGRGFEPNVGVDIFFDTKDKALVVTNGEGEFRDAEIFAPRGPASIGSPLWNGITTRAIKSRFWCVQIGANSISMQMAPA
jgi:hypothetical protein